MKFSFLILILLKILCNVSSEVEGVVILTNGVIKLVHLILI